MAVDGNVPGLYSLSYLPRAVKPHDLVLWLQKERTHGVVGGCILHVRSRDIFLSLRALFSTPPTPVVSNRYLFTTSVAVCGRRGRPWLIPRDLYRAPSKDHSQVHFVSPFSISPSKLDRLDCFFFVLPLPRRELRFRYSVCVAGRNSCGQVSVWVWKRVRSHVFIFGFDCFYV